MWLRLQLQMAVVSIHIEHQSADHDALMWRLASCQVQHNALQSWSAFAEM